MQVFFGTKKMDFNGLRLKYALEGTSNFVAWKNCREVLLDDHGLEYIMKNVAKTQEYDAQNLSQWRKYVAKGRGESSWW